MLNLLQQANASLPNSNYSIFIVLVLILITTTIILTSLRIIINYHLTQKLILNKQLSQRIYLAASEKRRLRAEIKKMQSYSATLELLQRQKQLFEQIHELTQSLPDNSFLVSLNFDQKGLMLDGVIVGSSIESIKKLKLHLEKKYQKRLKLSFKQEAHQVLFNIIIPLTNSLSENVTELKRSLSSALIPATLSERLSGVIS